MNEERRLQRRQRLMDNRAYQTMEVLTRYMDRYYLDALIGVIPGWGDAIALLCVVPFVYFSARVIKSAPLTLAVLNNALRDVLLGMIPTSLAVSHRPHPSSPAYRPHDMAAHFLRQLPVLSADIHSLSPSYLLRGSRQ